MFMCFDVNFISTFHKKVFMIVLNTFENNLCAIYERNLTQIKRF